MSSLHLHFVIYVTLHLSFGCECVIFTVELLLAEFFLAVDDSCFEKKPKNLLTTRLILVLELRALVLILNHDDLLSKLSILVSIPIQLVLEIKPLVLILGHNGSVSKLNILVAMPNFVLKRLFSGFTMHTFMYIPTF